MYEGEICKCDFCESPAYEEELEDQDEEQQDE
jgi:hypothetical protein